MNLAILFAHIKIRSYRESEDVMVAISENDAQLEINMDDLNKGITIRKMIVYGKENLRFAYRDTYAVVGIGKTSNTKEPWATVYTLSFDNGKQNVRDSVYLMKSLKKYFESLGYDFAHTSADTISVKGILYKAKVDEREQSIIKA